MPGLYGHTHQVHEYPDSTISKVLTVLKWRTLNRKVLEKQRVKNHFAPYEVHISSLFYSINAAVVVSRFTGIEMGSHGSLTINGHFTRPEYNTHVHSTMQLQ